MEKLLVILCVVPPIVRAPATATASQNSTTSALWRSTNLVREGILVSRVGAGGRSARHSPGCRDVAFQSSCRRRHLPLPRWEHTGRGVLPPEYPNVNRRDGEPRAARS